MEYPEIVVAVDRETTNLSRNPPIGQRLRPEGIRLKQRYL
jgi:hypothetical protein